MKIAVDCRMSGLSGIGVYLDNILDPFVNENKGDSFILIGNPDNLKRLAKYENCTIISTNINIFSVEEIIKFPVSEINKCDFFFTPNYNIPGGIKVPVYSMIHDVVFLDVKGLTSWIGRLIRWFFLFRALKKSKVIFTVSDFSKQRIKAHFGKTPEIVVVNSGISEELKEYKTTPKKLYDFEYILFIGNIKKHKGLSILLEAYEKSVNKGFDKKLIIVGSNKNFKTSDKKNAQIIEKQNQNIIFSGNISNKELFNIIQNASILIQPSLYEGFGLPPLEAMYLGCNVLISDIPVFHEVYKDFPVEFFSLADISMLSDKIINLSDKKRLDIDKIRPVINERYDLKRSARMIMSQFKKV